MQLKSVCAVVAVAAVSSAFAERITLKTDYASCVVETRGARIMSFRPKGGEEVVWQAEPEQVTAEKWAHGGIPACWPWFGVNGKIDIHGTAWREEFKVVSRRGTNRRAELVLALDGEKARLEYTVSLGDALKLEMKTVNVSREPFSFSAAFHPYFRVGDVTKCSVGGVNPEFKASAFTKPIPLVEPIDDAFPAGPGSCSIYRLADPVLDRTLYVFAENSTRVNIWNPGASKDAPGFIPGDSWRTFACVEPILGSVAEPVTVQPGDSLSLMMGVEVRKGSKTSGYLGKDPRRPSAADEPTGRPFHVLYLGAHPDDGDYDFAAQFVKLVRAGAKVTSIACCNGCKGHVDMTPEALAARRLKEAQSAAKVYGLERYIVYECPDCELDATRAWRERLGRVVRDIAPDMILTHRNVDYHSDHRAVGQLVQDFAYFLGVPHWCPDTPVPEKMPFVMYAVDGFTVPRRMRPDLVMSVDGAFEEAVKGLSCHASQVVEWMPPEYGDDPATLTTPEAKHACAVRQATLHYQNYGKPFGDLIEKLYGDRKTLISFAELSEYSRDPAAAELDFLTSVPGFKWTMPGRDENVR